MPDHATPDPATEAFIARWHGREGGAERANCQPFLDDLCTIIGVPKPDPADATSTHNDYVYERTVRGDDGNLKRIDLYKRGCFILEAKQSRHRTTTRSWDVMMERARIQAEGYARLLPPDHPWPPFILTCDIGHAIEIRADFTAQGRNYNQFPDRTGFRIALEDLRDPAIRERLRLIWTDPHALDPARRTATVTAEIAARIAAVAKSLETTNPPERVAMFLLRCLFTMFAEDVGLLPEQSFQHLLARCAEDPTKFVPMISQLWAAMNTGAYAYAIETQVRRFNGEFFRDQTVLPLTRADIAELSKAAEYDWKSVDPAIFGTLLEQALDPAERKRLGAHYTPRAYVERLVSATIIEPLRAQWNQHIATIARHRAELRPADAIRVARDFHAQLCTLRILDPACGTGNFLYVALELLKKLEGEILETLLDLEPQSPLAALQGFSVDPHQFLGLEANPRAAGIAELVLWIGYLQGYLRTTGTMPQADPVLRAFHNIQIRDAVLEANDPLSGDFSNPHAPNWPEAEYIVGNPPFIGGKDIRARLGDAYTQALWAAHPDMNDSADFVMYWWNHAATLLTTPNTPLRRFGFVTTNSITQVFQRRVLARHLDAKSPISLIFAIADHPWTRATPKAAAVRIAMTVAQAGTHEGTLLTVTAEAGLDTDTPIIAFSETTGRINPDLTIGTDLTSMTPLMANEGLCSRGVALHGAGFIVTPDEAATLGLGRIPGLDRHIRPYRNGRDLTARPRGVMVIDLFGLTEPEVRKRFPSVYQHLLTTVKPERDNNRETFRRENWWLFGRLHTELRSFLSDLPRYIATVETAKHRIFQFLDATILPDNKLIAIGCDDAFILGVLSANIHTIWALRAGGWLGVGNDSVYVKSRCFDPFPFPAATPAQRAAIADLAEEIDATRKRTLAANPDLTLTGLYNIRAKLQSGQPLDAAEQDGFARGLVGLLHELHTRLDHAVAHAYQLPPDAPAPTILAHLVALNTARATAEAEGTIAWLRPAYQIPRFGNQDQKLALQGGAIAKPTTARLKTRFPARDIEQTAAIIAALKSTPHPIDAATLARRFTQGTRIEPQTKSILTALASVGLVTHSPQGYGLNL
ncbi:MULTISPECIES: class I SAM-dependent DNA methyltransferase [Acidiphilium]|uniref:site-specific DNA-methyltransferase (adenine-specific) n=1 Tax=Acidiphilium rubrum TaxID=526 RepID=A0A8G2FD86_ACIRU|nr:MULTISPECIES: DNA methyltransferase [Acidiphilium]SIQ31501.1 Type II restriction/modification system, DNA methylase subunit YeeA [Acidiphilium rubrum]